MIAHIKTWEQRRDEARLTCSQDALNVCYRDAEIADLRAALAQKEAAAPGDEFAAYLKEGETPIQRLEREIRDSDSLASLLATEKSNSESWRDLMHAAQREATLWSQKLAALAHPVAVDVPSEGVIEGLEILDSLIDSIEEHGNYSKESTLTFLRQIKQCFSATSAIYAQEQL